MIMTTGITEIILPVENMEAMVSFYRDTLGLRVQYPQNIDRFEKEPSVTFWTGTCDLTLHARRTRGVGENPPRIVFGVRDIEHAQSYLCRRNVQVSELRNEASGVTICDGLDPEGNPFSLAYQELVFDVPSQPYRSGPFD